MRFSLNNPGSYNAASKIGSEFENIARYLVAAERGNKTIPELLATIFDKDGEWSGPVEVRFDGERGLEYRVGEYATDDLGWIQIADPSDLRGAPGSNAGNLNTPMFYGRQEATGDGTTVEFSYFHLDTDDLFVYLNGVLQSTSDYTSDATADTVTFTTAPANNDAITFLRFRKDIVTGYRRTEQLSSSGQAVFPFPHTEEETVVVYRNGILQREGGSYDYTASPQQDTVTFMTTLNANDLVTIFTVENQAVTAIGGLMLTDEYAPEGLIPYNKLKINDGELPQAKVNGLTTLLQNVRKVYVASTAPVSPTDGDLWVDTSANPVVLKFRSNGAWNNTTPNVTIPQFNSNNANQFLRVNATGQFFEFGSPDLSGLVPKSFIGASNGVAGLDANGKVPLAQMADLYSLRSLNLDQASVTNTTYKVQRIFKQKVRIDSIAAKTGSGSCTIQISVNGTTVGDTLAVSSTLLEQDLTDSITVDATGGLKTIEIVVTGNSAASDLEVTLAVSNLTA